MKLNEIMVFRPNDNGETRLRTFLVDNGTLSKLTQIRGNFYKDDPRLRLVRDLPKTEPEIPEHMRVRAEAALALYKMERQGSPVQTATPIKPVLSFEEKVKEDWRTRSDIRAEFVSFGSYQAFMKAKQAGKAKFYGNMSLSR
ncbi:hypothetical protein BAC3_00374 [uncultured bacterium]|nr:hypothetical protein BAC3_00374 [uncultured bacterium]